MKTYLYLSLLPEALVASQLAPDEYGAYLATGAKQRSRGQALFFRLSEAHAQTIITPEILGRMAGPKPRRSLYLSIYRVLERTPLAAIESLHLATHDGRVLSLSPGEYPSRVGPRFHLYQEYCPVTPRVVSELDPREFAAQITDTRLPVSLPALVFSELKLERLADDPEASGVANLPYPHLDHLRDCLRELRTKRGKPTKTVIRTLQQQVLFRTIEGGFYVATSGGGLRCFPMPSPEQLETVHVHWWRSAQVSE
ncbi:MAG: hypothetical protein JNN01_05730 [Opitutaceae bacterium]|nr:hypothetical protein [Opitutaceae bacterium]